MPPFSSLHRMLLPLAFLTYAVGANFQVFTGTTLPFRLAPLLQGAATRQIDEIYRQTLPHVSLSVGLIGALRYRLLNEARGGGMAGRDHWLFSQEELRELPTKAGGPTWASREISQISRQLAESGSRLILLPIPAKLDIYSAQANRPKASARLEKLHADFLRALKSTAIDAIDIRPDLNQAAGSTPVFFRTDTHWTPAGAMAAAQSIARSNLIDPGFQRFVPRYTLTKELQGDLVTFVTHAAFAQLAGLPSEHVTPFLAVTQNSDLSDLLAPATIDTVLVGTSFSANPNWSFAEALKLTLNRDILNVSAQGVGPVQPMHDYLRSPAYRDTPPKTVLWEFPIRYLTDANLWNPPIATLKGHAP